MAMAMAMATAMPSFSLPIPHNKLLHHLSSPSSLSNLPTKTQPPPPSPITTTTAPPNPTTKPPTIRSRLSKLCQDGQLDLARHLFDTISRPTTVLWNTIIIGFICNGMPLQALQFYSRMVRSPSIKSDSYTYSSVLKACADTRQLKLGKAVHCRILRTHAKLTAIVANSLLNMYSNCLNINSIELLDYGNDGVLDNQFSHLDLVQKVFDGMQKTNAVAYNTMIAWYVKTGRSFQALQQFKGMMRLGIKPTIVTFINVFPAIAATADWNNCNVLYGLLLKMGNACCNDLYAVSSAIFMYSELGDVSSARQVFDLCVDRNIEVWNTMISGYVQNECFSEVIDLFLQVLVSDMIVPDSITFVAVLTAVSQLQLLDFGQQVHAYVIKNSMKSLVIISNVLISMYSRCNSVEIAFRVFDEMKERDIVSWNTMVSAFVQNGYDDEGLMLAYGMQKQGMTIDSITATALLSAASNLRNSDLGKQIHAYLFRHGIRFEGMDSYLIDMYAKSGMVETAEGLFENSDIHARDQVTWNAMIAGYTQNGQIDQAFTVLRNMLEQNQIPNSVTLSSILPACIPIGGVSLGKQIHAHAIRHFMDCNVFVGTALIDMYSKCGSILHSERLCNRMPEKNSVTFTTMILGYGQHGLGERALSLFQSMMEVGLKPDAVTFVAVLSACSYAGLIDEGLKIFESMESKYKVSPMPEHYCCVVDMLGRAGRVVEAYEFANKLGDEGNIVGIWGSLLNACRIHEHLELGKVVVDRLFELEKHDDLNGYHVLLSNIYADKRMWDSVNRVRRDMRQKGLRKEVGCSWIEIGNVVNHFTARDQKHPQSDAIYAELEYLALEMMAAGYRPNAGFSSDMSELGE